MRRARMSVVLPAANPTTRRTGRLGYDCVLAMRGSAKKPAAASPKCTTSGAETSRCVPDNSLGCYTWQTKPLMLKNHAHDGASFSLLQFCPHPSDLEDDARNARWRD